MLNRTKKILLNKDYDFASPFDKDGGYNFIIIASPGKGKSFFASDIFDEMLGDKKRDTS